MHRAVSHPARKSRFTQLDVALFSLGIACGIIAAGLMYFAG